MYVSYDFTCVIPSAPNITREHPLLSKKITRLQWSQGKSRSELVTIIM